MKKFVTSYIWLASTLLSGAYLTQGQKAPLTTYQYASQQPGPLQLADRYIDANNMLSEVPSLKAQGWQLLAPGAYYKFKDDGVESQFNYVDMDATTLPIMRKKIAALSRQAVAAERRTTPAAKEQVRVYRMQAGLIRENLADIAVILEPFGGSLGAYQRFVIESYGVPTAGLTLREAKDALRKLQDALKEQKLNNSGNVLGLQTMSPMDSALTG